MDTPFHSGLTIEVICKEEPRGKTHSTFIHYPKSVNPQIHSIEEDEDAVERRLLAELKSNRAKKAQKEAARQIEQLRSARVAVLQQRRAEAFRICEAIDQEIGEIQSGSRDGELTAGIVAKAAEIQISTKPPTAKPTRPEGEKRERTIITRPPLIGLIKSPSTFRFSNKGKLYFCKSENGVSFKDNETKEVFKSLASWTVDVIERGGGGGRKVSAYEVCEIKINATGDWKKWGEIYHEDTTQIN